MARPRSALLGGFDQQLAAFGPHKTGSVSCALKVPTPLPMEDAEADDMLSAQPRSLPNPPQPPIVVRADQVDAGWCLPDANDGDDCIPLDEADLIEVPADASAA